MRATAYLTLVLLSGCDQLWGTYVQPNPKNCVTSANCGAGKTCNPSTGNCDAPPAPNPTPVCDPAGFCWENPLPQGNDLYRAWGSSAGNVWFVGKSGTILHWD